jgi:hypothetical protein
MKAIRAWIEETVARYDDQADVRSATPSGFGVEVLADISGTFPGSPVRLRFNFTLDEDQIIRVEIAP